MFQIQMLFKYELVEMDSLNMDLIKKLLMNIIKVKNLQINWISNKQKSQMNIGKRRLKKREQPRKKEGIDDIWFNIKRIIFLDYQNIDNETLKQGINELNYKIQEIEKEQDYCRNKLMQIKHQRDIVYSYFLPLRRLNQNNHLNNRKKQFNMKEYLSLNIEQFYYRLEIHLYSQKNIIIKYQIIAINNLSIEFQLESFIKLIIDCSSQNLIKVTSIKNYLKILYFILHYKC
ncbi:unnamed protein product [Paramecium sonneborni]|uniref:Uncharacterized protein n=1 Tax=Paramecium sonneborni TaxID=65129 RepID=A0A8S1N2J7_9CILI|nr:unnamed protein product [Paramecium sonneborni]